MLNVNVKLVRSNSYYINIINKLLLQKINVTV